MEERSISLVIKFLVPFLVIFLIIVIKREFKNYKKDAIQSDIEIFKLKSDKILVNLSDAEISSVYYSENAEDLKGFRKKNN